MPKRSTSSFPRISNRDRRNWTVAALQSRSAQWELYSSHATQGLAWEIIYLLALSAYDKSAVAKSDVYRAVRASKVSTLKMINQMVAEGVLALEPDAHDKRRTIVKFTASFARKYKAFVDQRIIGAD